MQAIENLRDIIYEKVTEEYGWGKYGDFKVLIRYRDGYINATKLCQDGEKRLENWMRNDKVKELISECESQARNNRACETILGGQNTTIRGTYVHPDLVPHIASWISPKFAIFVSQIIREWRAISSFNETLFWTKVGDCVINHPYSSDQEERKWQEIVAARENGEREVETSCGRIDVLSATKVIEVKRAALWKAAVGQVLCYLEEYENRKASLYLFDAAEAPKDIIEKCCKRLNVEVNYL